MRRLSLGVNNAALGAGCTAAPIYSAQIYARIEARLALKR
jgi:hypothetical protein